MARRSRVPRAYQLVIAIFKGSPRTPGEPLSALFLKCVQAATPNPRFQDKLIWQAIAARSGGVEPLKWLDSLNSKGAIIAQLKAPAPRRKPGRPRKIP